jgi:hypothetical protein
MTVSPETLLAFVEGELSPEEARKVAAEVANDPALASHVEKHRALKARLHEASLPMTQAAMPESVTSNAPPPVERVTPMPPASESIGVRRSWIPAGAMAVGIALGALLAFTFLPAGEIRSVNGAAVADGALARALSTVIVSEQDKSANSGARIQDSFFSGEGYFCRDFTTSGDAKDALAGIACRESSGWRIRVLAAAGGNGKSDAPVVPASVRDTLDAMIVGKPLDADNERAARSQDWIVK